MADRGPSWIFPLSPAESGPAFAMSEADPERDLGDFDTLVWELTADGSMLDVSTAWQKFTGQTRDAASGSGWLAAVEVQASSQSWRRDLARGHPFFADWKLRASDGEWLLSRVQLIPLSNSSGVVEAWIASVPMPRASSEREAARGSGRDSKILEALHQAEGRVRDAERRKEEFLAILGHELRNPLAPIVTALQLMAIKQGAEAVDHERQVIERQVRHLVELVDDLLDVSRLTRGKINLSLQKVELASVVTRAIEMASPLLEEREHKLTISVPRGGLKVRADPDRMAQVFRNLLHNAAKFTDAGGYVGILAHRDPQADEVVIRVEDAGIGIPPELLPCLFDLFSQGERALDRSPGGLGIGLTIAKNLIELHGGRIEVFSAGLGQGSTFTVRLPAAVSTGSSTSSLRAVNPGADSLRVLIVDDNADAAQSLSEALSIFSHETLVARDGPSALEQARYFQPQVALLDIGLPVMDGYELAGRLRELPGLSRLHLVAITGYGQEADHARSRAIGIRQHLVKPVQLEELKALLKKIARDLHPPA